MLMMIMCELIVFKRRWKKGERARKGDGDASNIDGFCHLFNPKIPYSSAKSM